MPGEQHVALTAVDGQAVALIQQLPGQLQRVGDARRHV